MKQRLSPDAKARGFGQDIGIDIFADTHGMGRVAARLAPLDQRGDVAVHITDKYGADYYTSRIDYRRGNKLMGSRAIAVVMAGYHTKFGYWPESAEPKKISIHSGQGHLIVGDPEPQDDVDLDGIFSTQYFTIDATVTPFITLQPGHFYTLEAAAWSTLVVSAVSEVDAQGHWGAQEIPVEPGRPVIKTPEGSVPVPEEFVTADFN